MFLTASNMLHYLVARGALSAGAVVDGDVMVVEAGRRNRNYKVMRRAGTGLFVKQVKSLDGNAISTLQREAACYKLVQRNGDYHQLTGLMPKLIDHDPNRHCLLLELLPDAENLAEYHLRRALFPAEIGQMLGRSLGNYHQTLRGKQLQAADIAHFPRQTPWILSWHHADPASLGVLGGGTRALIEVIRSHPDLHLNLDRLRQQWRQDSVIHGDIKWDNCVVLADADGRQQLKIIDWELVDYGDASWDIGAVFQAYLSFWIFSMPLQQQIPLVSMIEKATCRIEAMHPALQAFWQAYVQATAIPRPQAAPYLLRCIRYGAARMVQTAYESLFYAPHMTSHAAALLQVSENILRDAKDAATGLFGFHPNDFQ